MDKYFNYGFNEETWRYHSKEVLHRAALMQKLMQRNDLQKYQTEIYRKNKRINFVLPHQFGGFGDPDLEKTYNVHVPVQKASPTE